MIFNIVSIKRDYYNEDLNKLKAGKKNRYLNPDKNISPILVD